MTHISGLPRRAEVPVDARDSSSVGLKFDRVIYRLGLHALPVPGLPASFGVDDVRVDFVEGPILAQRTEVRQRHGLPFVFDKHMSRSEAGDGELVCLLSIEADKPPDLQQAFRRWRSRALAAAGLVASILDERVVGAQIFEDALLVHDGEVVSAADLRAGIRTFLPLEVHAADRAALEKLGSVQLAESSDVARAARLYRRAVLEGPSADAFSLLWIAAECFGTHGTPSRREIEASLVRAGISPDTLPLHVGLLIG